MPEKGDFYVSVTSRPEEQWAVYRLLRVVLERDEVEPWCRGGHPDVEGEIPEGMVVRVLHFRLGMVRVPRDERPTDAMTWRGVADKRDHRH